MISLSQHVGAEQTRQLQRHEGANEDWEKKKIGKRGAEMAHNGALVSIQLGSGEIGTSRSSRGEACRGHEVRRPAAHGLEPLSPVIQRSAAWWRVFGGRQNIRETHAKRQGPVCVQHHPTALENGILSRVEDVSR